MRGFPASRSTPAAEGMATVTESDAARETRRLCAVWDRRRAIRRLVGYTSLGMGLGRRKRNGRDTMQPIISDTPYKHIFIMEDGLAMIGGTRIKVEYVVIANRMGETPEQITQNYAGLTLEQVHSALAYYYDNKELVDAQIEVGSQFAENMRLMNRPYQSSRESLLRSKAEGKKPNKPRRMTKEQLDRNGEEIERYAENLRRLNETFQPEIARLIREKRNEP